ncbi:MAG TPA: 16S rRNA (guanine(966)-N(2))-methyltransferase RsmD [Hyphomicrobiaceae bacterium]|nr:16S rRNA (guanine(966)-N(2))-methyltransferase RsmD [Hyphomicrobiaceae bacterium]
MRIVGGRFRGRPIATPMPGGQAIRPTSDRVRQALFDILMHGIADFDLDGTRVLDLFAGTGALAFEALSRGAASAVLVDESAAARALMRETIVAIGLAGRARILKRDATDLGPAEAIPPANLVFADPPYGKSLGERAIASAIAGGWIAEGALIVLEEAEGSTIGEIAGTAVIDERAWGGTLVRFMQLRTRSP